MNSESEIRVGLIGAGLQGRRRAGALKQDSSARLVVVTDTDIQKANSLAAEMQCEATGSWTGVIERDDVQLVLVCTPPNLHASICIDALKQAKHVLCEKPLATDVTQAKASVETAQQNGVKLKCGFNLRHHPGIQQARKWVGQGLIGEPISLRCAYGIGGRPGYEKDWRMDPKVSGGGELIDQGIHVMDLSRWFLGDFSEVFGFLQTGVWDIAPLEDNAFALLRTDKGQVASVHVSWTQWRNLFSLHVLGQDGYVTVEGLGGSYGTEKAIIGKRAFLKPFTEEVIEYRGDDLSWHEEWREFVSAIRENREPLGSGYDGLKALELVQAIYRSATIGQATSPGKS